MDILIKNVEKWTCFNCPFKFSRYNDLMCPFVGEVGSTVFVKDRHDDCPLVELPPHGELVQRSDILRLFDENKLSAREAVMKAPTILEASI